MLSHQCYHNLFQEKVTSRKRSIGLGSGGAGEISDYQVNIMNMAKYVQSFQDRDDVSDKLKTQLKVDCLLITGSKSSSLKACDAMFQCCDKVLPSSYLILNHFNVKINESNIFQPMIFMFSISNSDPDINYPIR